MYQSSIKITTANSVIGDLSGSSLSAQIAVLGYMSKTVGILLYSVVVYLSIDLLIVLWFNDTSSLVGQFVLSPSEW